MTADDVRARFEAWVQGTRGWAACKARNKPMYLRQTSDGNYCDYRVNDRWMAYRAAHADLSGEVRELVEADRAYDEAQKAYGDSLMKDAGVTQRAWNRLGKAFERRATALAKFTQEEP